jgi:HlyD family secretion protein
MKKILVGLIAAAVLAGLGAAYFKPGSSNVKESGQTHKVTRGDLVVTVSASGAIEPSFQVEVKSKASGEILEFEFEPGDRVQKGNTLLTLDQRTERRNLAQQEADLARVLSELESARADLLERNLNLNRTRKLFEQKLVSDQGLDSASARAAIGGARVGEVKAAIIKARLTVEDAKERLDDTVIVSPIDGVIVEKSVEKGQIISSGISSFTGGTKLCVIADLSRMFIIALVDETDIGKVIEGQKVNVSVEAYPERTFEGVVTRIYPTGETSDNITVFKVKVEILDLKKAALRPRMTANVDMIIDIHKNALIIPDEALRVADGDGEKLFVYVQNGRKISERDVTVGLSNGFETEIIEGLKEGELILLNVPRSNDTSRRYL